MSSGNKTILVIGVIVYSTESDRPGLMKNIGGALVPEAMPQFSVSTWFYTHIAV